MAELEAPICCIAGTLTMDPIQSLLNSWDEGEEWAYPDSKRVPASDEEISCFEKLYDVVLPDLAREFYRRVKRNDLRRMGT